METKNRYVAPEMKSRAIRVASLLAGSDAAQPGMTVNFTTDKSINPNMEALAKRRGASMD